MLEVVVDAVNPRRVKVENPQNRVAISLIKLGLLGSTLIYFLSLKKIKF